MLLEDKNAVIYGADGSVGGAVVRAFAWEEAGILLVSRAREPLGAVAAGVMSARVTTKGGVCHVGNEQPAREAEMRMYIDAMSQVQESLDRELRNRMRA